MPTADVIDAWTDLDTRAALSADELALLPAHPAGDLDEELRQLTPEMTGGPTTYCTQWSSRYCCC